MTMMLSQQAARTCCPRQPAVPGLRTDLSVTSPRPPPLTARHTKFAQPDRLMACQSVDKRQPIRSSTSSVVQFLQGVELVSISVAAAYQAAVLIRLALQLMPAQQQGSSRLLGLGIQHAAEAQQQHQTHQQQTPAQTHILQLDDVRQQHTSAASLPGLQSVALLLALICGVAIRYLQPPRFPTKALSADAAARLLAVEFLAHQQAAQITDMTRQLDKLQTRVRLSTRDVKVPLRQAQGGAAQAAAALTKLSEQQLHLQKQLDGSQELIAALQGLAAKQFQVSAEALQQLKAGQAQLSNSLSTTVADVRKQHQALQQQLQLQQQQMARIEGQHRQNQHSSQWQHEEFPGRVSSNSSNGIENGVIPDPWFDQGQTAHHNGVARSLH